MAVSLRLHAPALSKLKKFLSKGYRDAYLENSVRSGVAYQIQALRKSSGLSQSEFAAKLGKPQSSVCRLEREAYGRVSVSTLLDIAKALDVGLVVRFTNYVNVLTATSHMSESDLEVDTIFETVEKAMVQGRQSSRAAVGQTLSELSGAQEFSGRTLQIGRFPRGTFADVSSSSSNAAPSNIQIGLQ